jgi:hypothetical protein
MFVSLIKTSNGIHSGEMPPVAVVVLLGVLKVSALCQSLENNAKNENFKEAKILFNELCSELVTAQEHLQEKHHLNL